MERIGYAVAKSCHARYAVSMTDRARKLLEDAMTLSEDERLDLAEQLMSSLPPMRSGWPSWSGVRVGRSRIRRAAKRGTW